MLGFHSVAIGCINRVTALMAFSYKKIYGHFAGTKKSGINSKVAILMRWPY